MPNLNNLNDPFSGTSSLSALFTKIVGGLVPIFGIIFVGLLIYGGYQYMNSQGDQGKIKQAQAIMTSAIIGLLIVLGAFVMKQIVFKVLNV